MTENRTVHPPEPYLPPDNPVRVAFEKLERWVDDWIRRDAERDQRLREGLEADGSRSAKGAISDD
jgi:hypothetical protein